MDIDRKITYYSLGRMNTIVARVINDGESAEFFPKRGWEDEVESFKLRAEVLTNRSGSELIKPYTRTVLFGQFKNTEVMDEASFNKAVAEIEQFNAQYDTRQNQIDEMTNAQLGVYITEFSSKHPKLANYAEVNKIWTALSVAATDSFDDEEERSDEDIRDDLKALYSILRDAEERNDRSVIQSMLTAIGEDWSVVF